MTKASFGEAWEDALSFGRRQHSLLLPIGFAFFSLPTLLLSWARPAASADPTVPPQVGPWMLLMIPLLIAYLIGSVAISALALHNDLSVREAVLVGVRKLGLGARIFGLFFLGAFVIATIAGLFGGVASVGGVPMQKSLEMLITIFGVLGLWLAARMLPITALVTDRDIGAWAAIRESFRLTRGSALKLVGFVLLFFVVSAILSLAIQFTIGSILIVLGRISGDRALGDFLGLLLSALVSGILTTGWSVYAAMLYRRLASSNGI